MTVPYLIDDKLIGCIEFFSMEEWAHIPEMVKKIEHYTNISTQTKIDRLAFMV